MEKIDWNDWFYYDETSPSCLRWKVDRRTGKNLNIIKVKKDDVAGSIDNKYYRVMLHNRSYLCHRIIYELISKTILNNGEQVDHIDGDTFNNKITNLRSVTPAINSRNCSKRKDNSTGATGVYIYLNGKNRSYYVSNWRDINKKQKSKCFRIEKLGLLPAFAQAVAYREKMIDELNKQGACYSNRHGV